MKSAWKLFIFLILLLFITVSCEVTDVDIESRIRMFEDDLAGSRNGIWRNFSSSETNDYSAISVLSYWQTGFWSNDGFEFNNLVVGSSTATCDVSFDGGGPIEFVFEMVSEKDGLTTTWYIEELEIEGQTGIYYIGN